MKNNIPYFILLLLLLVHFRSNAQSIEWSNSKTLLKKNEHFFIRIHFSAQAKKEFQLYKKYKFPDLVDVAKLNTLFEENDNSFTITQWYKPLKAGNIHYPSIKIEDRYHKFYTFPSTSFHIQSEATNNPLLMPSEKNDPKNNFDLDLPELNIETDISSNKILAGQAFTVHYFILIPNDNSKEFSFIQFERQQEEIKKRINPFNEAMIDYASNQMISVDTIEINNKIFYRYNLAQCILFPQKTFKLNKFKYQYIGYAKSYDADEGAFRKEQIQSIESEEQTITVLPLKEAYPNTIGNFEIKVLSVTKQVNKYNPIECVIQIKGNGNIPQMSNLQAFPPFTIENKEILQSHVLSFAPYTAEIRLKIKLLQTQTGKFNLSHHLFFPFWNVYTNKKDSLPIHTWVNISENETTEETQSILDDPFYKRFLSVEHQFYSKNKDQDFMNSLVNLLILIMFVITAILVIKK